MTKSKVVGDAQGTILQDLRQKLENKSHTEEQIKDFLKKLNPFPQNGLEQSFNLYRLLRFSSDNRFLEGLKIPKSQGFNRLIWVHPHVQLSSLIFAFEAIAGMRCIIRAPLTLCGPLDTRLWGTARLGVYLDSTRKLFSKSYAFWVNDEADVSLQSKSSRSIREIVKSPITLEECLLHRLLRALEDQRFSHSVATLCAGSRVDKVWTPVVYSEYVTNEKAGWVQLCINFVQHDDAGPAEHAQTFLGEGRYLHGWEVIV
jgi:hypothetical protein